MTCRWAWKILYEVVKGAFQCKKPDGYWQDRSRAGGEGLKQVGLSGMVGKKSDSWGKGLEATLASFATVKNQVFLSQKESFFTMLLEGVAKIWKKSYCVCKKHLQTISRAKISMESEICSVLGHSRISDLKVFVTKQIGLSNYSGKRTDRRYIGEKSL